MLRDTPLLFTLAFTIISRLASSFQYSPKFIHLFQIPFTLCNSDTSILLYHIIERIGYHSDSIMSKCYHSCLAWYFAPHSIQYTTLSSLLNRLQATVWIYPKPICYHFIFSYVTGIIDFGTSCLQLVLSPRCFVCYDALLTSAEYLLLTFNASKWCNSEWRMVFHMYVFILITQTLLNLCSWYQEVNYSDCISCHFTVKVTHNHYVLLTGMLDRP